MAGEQEDATRVGVAAAVLQQTDGIDGAAVERAGWRLYTYGIL